MRESTARLLRCPSCGHAELSVTAASVEGDRILEGTLGCAGCGRKYGIRDGIAAMLPAGLACEDESELDPMERERKRSEMAARDAQVEDYDRMRGLALFGRVEVPVTLRYLGLQSGDLLLEAGCGTGRMTPVFAGRCRSQIAVDFSGESLRVCSRKLQRAGITNVDLIQADVCALPFRDEVFDRVVSCQVLEHIPTPESRSRMVGELARSVRSDGTVVVSAYQHSLLTRLFGRKEGAHDGGIYYYRFCRRELRSLLGGSLEVQRVTGALVYHYLARCRKARHSKGLYEQE